MSNMYWLLAAVFIIGAECASPETYVCGLQAKDRVDCGGPGITRDQCKALHCCYDEKVPNTPWCYYPYQIKGCSENPTAQICNKENPSTRTRCPG
ncbi:hypothetical protein, partial [Ciceribacter ferrooxidans]